jgi:ATP-dependent RNA helicase DHX37/DHR1
VAEPEAEDLEIGGQNDLAADVDDGDAAGDSDPEGLDSSDDEDDGLGLDMVDEDSEGELPSRRSAKH